jgi:hypothetical protein
MSFKRLSSCGDFFSDRIAAAISLLSSLEMAIILIETDLAEAVFEEALS